MRRAPVGVVGLGLMGRGIATCLVANGFQVIACDHSSSQTRKSSTHVKASLDELVRRKLLSRARGRAAFERFRAVRSMESMNTCDLVIESVDENIERKRSVYRELESVLPPDAIIASNTSSIPITELQSVAAHPERFIGMHWGEPAQITRYLEIVPGRLTSAETIGRAKLVGERCGKAPTILNIDIRGFISNRMMYAMIREACHLVEAGVADIETVDRSFRNDIGFWATLAGPFRWMDLTGIPAYAAVMDGLLPELSNEKSVPRIVQQAVARGDKGVSNSRGFYRYKKASAKQWERAWVDFTYDARQLADKYERRLKP